MSKCYDFILIQWQLKVFSNINVQNAVNKGYITQDEANTILATPQV